MKEWILLDNKFTVTIFCNQDMVTNFCPANNELLDLITNARILCTMQKATIPGWGKAWFNLQAIINIFSYAEMAKHHQITYNSSKQDTFIVHLLDKQVKFTKTDQGLYI
jgi:hypothetical protein